MTLRSLIPLPLRRSIGGQWHKFLEQNRRAKLLRRLRGDAVECNVCHWTGSSFTDDQWHPKTICPTCGSQVRHRILTSILDGKILSSQWNESSLLEGRDILHFAPERQLRDRIKRAAGRYVTADYERGDCDLHLNLSQMPGVDSSSFDVVIACDVLEHVPDDRSAYAEIHRVLKTGGLAILTVPQRDSPAVTDEDETIVTEEAREKRFGQKDHVRMFGDDFADRLRAAGFDVAQIDGKSFPEPDQSRLVLIPPVLSRHPLATNHRRIYLARKV